MSNYGIFNSNGALPFQLNGQIYNKTTNALSSEQSNTLDLVVGYDFYIVWVSVNNKARIRGYSDGFTRSNDINRELNNTSSFPNNCVFDFILNTKFYFYLPFYFVNLQNPQEKKIYLTITNLEDSTKIIEFNLSCLEVSNKSWLLLSGSNSPFILTDNDRKVMLTESVDLQTNQNSLPNYLIYSQVEGSTLNSLSLESSKPQEIIFNYNKEEYEIFVKTKNLKPDKTNFITYSSRDLISGFSLSNSLRVSFKSIIDSYSYNNLLKSSSVNNNSDYLKNFNKADSLFTFLEVVDDSFSVSYFSNKFELVINKENISFIETTTVPIIIDSDFSDVFSNITDETDIAVGNNQGDLFRYRISAFDLTNQIIIIHVDVDLDPNADTSFIVYLNNSSSLSFETNVTGFTFTNYLPLETDAKDIISKISSTGSYSATNDAERGDYLEFDGQTHHLQLPVNSNYFQENNQYTICMWIKPTTLTTDESNHNIANCLLAQSSDTENDILEIGIDESANVLEIYQDTESQDTLSTITTSNTIDEGVWSFIAIVSDPTNSYLRVNVDGEIVEDTSWQSAFDNTNADITLATNYHTLIYYHGGIQELIMSNQAISLNLFDNINSLINNPINFFNFTGVLSN